ncbi:MAG TPA: hypothetical protein VG387_20115 [Rhizomicrobium sp.]|jgi:hypothetical protein|nr:hypothetical protein [Rhizomicrobium sp.]
MRKRLIAALIGAGAGALALCAYYALLYAGIRIRPELLIGGAAALVFAGAVAVFSLVAMDRPAFRKVRPAILLNEEPAKEFIYPFKPDGAIQIAAKPEQSVGEMLVRYGDAFKAAPDKLTKDIVLTVRAGKTDFPHQSLLQLFAILGQYNLEHVILLDEKGDFVGYIPGKRAKKEFTGEKALANIDKYIVTVLKKPAESAVLRDLGGATRDDTIEQNDTSMNAQAKLWANDKVQGLIVHQHLKPVGFISRMDVLRINAGML